MRLVDLGLAALLAGNEVGTWAVVHPAVGTLPVAEQVAAEQALTRRYGVVMPPLMSSCLAASLVVAARLPVGSAPQRLTTAAATCQALMLTITLTGNVPINAATLRTSRDVDPATWRALRSRWNSLHTARVALDLAAVALLVAAVRTRHLRPAPAGPSDRLEPVS